MDGSIAPPSSRPISSRPMPDSVRPPKSSRPPPRSSRRPPRPLAPTNSRRGQTKTNCGKTEERELRRAWIRAIALLVEMDLLRYPPEDP